MTDFEQQVTEIEVHGFTIVPDVIDIQQVNEMRQVLIDRNSKRGDLTYNRGVALKLPNLVTLDPVFFTGIDHPRILPLMEHFLEQKQKEKYFGLIINRLEIDVQHLDC